MSPRTLGLLDAGVILVAAWNARELRARESRVDMRMMSVRASGP